MDQGQSPNQCPKCGSPRDPQAADCGFCGIVFDRYDYSRHQPPPPRQPTPTPTSPAPPAGEPLAPPPPPVQPAAAAPVPAAPEDRPPAEPQPTASASRRPAGPPLQATAHDRFLESIKDNLGALVLVALLIHLGVAAMFSMYVIGGSDETMRVRAIHRSAMDQPIPEGFGDGAALWFVGHQAVFLSNPSNGMVYVLYYRGALAGSTNPEELKEDLLGLFDQFEVPWKRTGKSQGKVQGQSVEVDRLEIEFQPNYPAHAYLSIFSTPQGRTVAIFFMGQEEPATDLAKELFTRGF